MGRRYRRYTVFAVECCYLKDKKNVFRKVVHLAFVAMETLRWEIGGLT